MRRARSPYSTRNPSRGWSHEQRRVPLPTGGLRIAVVADTHSLPHPGTWTLIADYAPTIIIHAGDIGDFGVINRLEAIAPTHAVRGNIDGHGEGFPDSLCIDVTDPDAGQARLLRIYLTHIAVYGARLKKDAREHAAQLGADLVICGHSHVPLLLRDRGMPVFNPGSCGPRRYPLPILFGTLDISDQGTRFRHISCETGLPWRPE